VESKPICPSSGITQGYVKFEDDLTPITTYRNGMDIWFDSLSSNNVKAGTVSLIDWSIAVDLDCGEKYKPVALTLADKTSSVVGQEFIATGPNSRQRLLGSSIRQLEVRIKNLITDSYIDITNTQDTDNTNSQQLDSDSTTTSTFAIESDDYIDIQILLKSNESKTVFGEEGLYTFLCVDSNKDVWEQPLVSVGENLGINVLTDMFSRLKPSDSKALADYEYCYSIGQIGGVSKSINYYQETAIGTNPTSEDSPKLLFVAEGRYLSSKEVDEKGDKKILVGAFQDDTSSTLVATVNPQKIILEVS